MAEFFCRSCRTPFLESYPLDAQELCTGCREGNVSFDAAYSFGSYEDFLQQLIHLFKYGKIETLAAPLSKLLLRALPREESFDLIQAMPMHWRKKWTRGFNQAEELARPVAKRFGLPLANELRRTRYTQAQAGLDQTERQKNLKGSFAVKRPDRVNGKRILLVDDVFTTGATLRAATEALKQAGAARVTALTLARVDRRGAYSGSAVLPFESQSDGAWTEPATALHGTG